MNYPDIAVNDAAMRDGVANLEDSKTTMLKLKQSLEKELNHHTREWEGDAVHAYAKVLKTWEESMTDMENIIKAISLSLGQINHGYQRNEQAITDNLSARR